VDFLNSAEVGIFSELVFTSEEYHVIPYAKFSGIPEEKLHGIPKEKAELLHFGDMKTWKHGERM
jgi:hypothetical protein